MIRILSNSKVKGYIKKTTKSQHRLGRDVLMKETLD